MWYDAGGQNLCLLCTKSVDAGLPAGPQTGLWVLPQQGTPSKPVRYTIIYDKMIHIITSQAHIYIYYHIYMLWYTYISYNVYIMPYDMQYKVHDFIYTYISYNVYDLYDITKNTYICISIYYTWALDGSRTRAPRSICRSTWTISSGRAWRACRATPRWTKRWSRRVNGHLCLYRAFMIPCSESKLPLS